MLFDEEWTEWLPIYAWVIDHDEGIIVVDGSGGRERVPASPDVLVAYLAG
jgi:hypothetical protein